MIVNLFNTIPYNRQLVAVFDCGMFTARLYEKKDAMNLCYLFDSFFVELTITDTHNNGMVRLQAFTDVIQIVDYTLYIRHKFLSQHIIQNLSVS